MASLPRWFALVFAAVAVLLSFASPATAEPSPKPPVIEKKTEEIFNRPEFQSDRPEPPSKRKTRERSSFRESDSGGPVSAGGSVIIWVIGAIFLIGLIAFLVYQLRSKFVKEDKQHITPERAQRLWLSETYRVESERLAEAGDYTEAIRHLFLSLVYRFDERGRVSFHKEYTNREYVDLMSERVGVREAVQILVDILDVHWYGESPCRREQYEESLAVYNRLAS
jgi:hypothetical protein